MIKELDTKDVNIQTLEEDAQNMKQQLDDKDTLLGQVKRNFPICSLVSTHFNPLLRKNNGFNESGWLISIFVAP